MSDCNLVSTPVETGIKLTKEMGPKDAAEREDMANIPYQEAVGSLLFAAQVLRPDLQFAVNMVCRFSHNPGRQHWNAVKRIFRYIKGTMDARLTYRLDDEAGLHYRRSVTGYTFMLQGAAISWNSKKQPTVALSTTEAEYGYVDGYSRSYLASKFVKRNILYRVDKNTDLWP